MFQGLYMVFLILIVLATIILADTSLLDANDEILLSHTVPGQSTIFRLVEKQPRTLSGSPKTDSNVNEFRLTQVRGGYSFRPTEKRMVISLRGSPTEEILGYALQIAPKAADEVCVGCKFHTGFYKLADYIYEPFVETMMSAGKKAGKIGGDGNPLLDTIDLAGHSMGGTIAPVLMARLISDMRDPKSPYSSNSDLKNIFNADGTGKVTIRITAYGSLSMAYGKDTLDGIQEKLDGAVTSFTKKVYNNDKISLFFPGYSDIASRYTKVSLEGGSHGQYYVDAGVFKKSTVPKAFQKIVNAMQDAYNSIVSKYNELAKPLGLPLFQIKSSDINLPKIDQTTVDLGAQTVILNPPNPDINFTPTLPVDQLQILEKTSLTDPIQIGQSIDTKTTTETFSTEKTTEFERPSIE